MVGNGSDDIDLCDVNCKMASRHALCNVGTETKQNKTK